MNMWKHDLGIQKYPKGSKNLRTLLEFLTVSLIIYESYVVIKNIYIIVRSLRSRSQERY